MNDITKTVNNNDDVKEVNEVKDSNQQAGQEFNDAVKDDKKFTQDDVDKLLKKQSKRYLKKIDTLSNQVSESRMAEKIKKEIAEGLGFTGTDEELLMTIAEHYGKDGAKVLTDYRNGDITKREADVKLKTLEFLEDEDTTDNDVVTEYESIADKPKSKLTKNDILKMELLSKRYFKIVSKNEASKSEIWYKKNVGDDFEKLAGSADFRDFIKDLNIPLSSAVEKYCKLKGLCKDSSGKKNVTREKTISMGSVSDDGTGTPEFFSKEDVDKMTTEQVLAHYDAVKKSERQWSKSQREE